MTNEVKLRFKIRGQVGPLVALEPAEGEWGDFMDSWEAGWAFGRAFAIAGGDMRGLAPLHWDGALVRDNLDLFEAELDQAPSEYEQDEFSAGALEGFQGEE